jgi:ADP-ribose pyrophosphatase
LAERSVESSRIYDGRIIRLKVDKVKLPNGRITTREVVEHKPAVVILAENEDEEVLLINQFRYPAGETLIELPAGIVEQNEDYREAAIRELQEETGWKPRTMTKVAEFYTSPGFSSELLILFHAAGLAPDKLPADDDEFIIPQFASMNDIELLLKEGAVRDGKTLFGLYWWLHEKRAG